MNIQKILLSRLLAKCAGRLQDARQGCLNETALLRLMSGVSSGGGTGTPGATAIIYLNRLRDDAIIEWKDEGLRSLYDESLANRNSTGG